MSCVSSQPSYQRRAQLQRLLYGTPYLPLADPDPKTTQTTQSCTRTTPHVAQHPTHTARYPAPKNNTRPQETAEKEATGSSTHAPLPLARHLRWNIIPLHSSLPLAQIHMGFDAHPIAHQLHLRLLSTCFSRPFTGGSARGARVPPELWSNRHSQQEGKKK